MRRTFYCTLWLLVFVVAHTYAMPQRFIEVHELNSKESPVDQLAPMDPALHAFPTTPTVPLLPNCMTRGYFRDPFNCGKFYFCEHDHAVPIAYYCEPGLIFNSITDSCDLPQYVQC
ncbi:hypothetical protein DMN91_005934 [Ooceraea biroi]|uniref:Chitin-binding type-2 domain-containing protein n=1 Tax=Ooceraea biroi TaxID=2015173 RepID=A0A026VTZ7_OOCBI|nr:uncharacterized protein LOC105286646 [Ooceraea biroi]EZA47278.1 hypothetical protein X777_16529 [Ooceraea biroi]RLU21561.1 hypothetical protein DMN91_005934 [Ooceraea biroi]